ncbi:MAG: FMN-binding protein, partial [Clostridia bacterium]|nr:FMN-binding protein [Clostridia bacterium]
MKKAIKSTVVLVGICAVMAILLALTNALTAPIIAENQNAAANQALLQVMPNGEGFESVEFDAEKLPKTIKEVFKEKNGGYVFNMETTGYGAGLLIMCGVNADGTVSGVVCLGSSETLGHEKTFGANFAGKDAAGVDAVDTISGATKTTEAFKGAVKDALNAAIVLSGGTADFRTEEEIFADNLNAALPEANGEFTKKAIVNVSNVIDFIYEANNRTGYVYVIDKVFVGINATGEVITEDVSAEHATLAQEKATLAATQTVIDTTDSGINSNITLVQKTSDNRYIININGIGFAYLGDDHVYQPARNIPIQICVVISADGTILECLTVAHEESGGYGAACGEKSYYSQFVGKNSDTYQEVDAITGATITTHGYMKAIERALE